MLYNNDDEDESSNKYYLDYGQRKLNTKKVATVISTVLLFAIILVGAIWLSINRSIDKNKISATEIQETNTIKEDYLSAKDLAIAPHSGEKIMDSFLPQENPNAQDEIKKIYYSDEKVVYLTFDDGPSNAITPGVLDVLKEENVPATFFVLGKCVKQHPELVKREFEEGHFIANHGYTHTYSQIYRSSQTVYDEYIQCEQEVQTALDNPRYHTRLFRFPGGSSGGKYNSLKQQAKQYMWSQGIANTNWNALTGDAEGLTTPNQLYNRMVETVGRQGSIVLLMHDAADKKGTLECLPRVIQFFRDKGYTFKNFYEIY